MKNRLILGVGLLGLLAGCTQPAPSPFATAPVGADTLNVADAAIAGGDPNMALSVSQSVLKDDPGNVDGLVHEGDAYYALGRCPAAEAAYQLALRKDPRNSGAETGLGRCLIKTDPPAAEAALVQAVQDDPGNAAALNDLGIARDLQGNFGGAVQPYQNALLAQPGMLAAEINLGLSLALSGHGAEAAQYLGPLATSPGANAKTREDFAAALVAEGQINQARQVLRVDLSPQQVDNAIAGFSALVNDAQPPLPMNAPAEAAATTTPELQTASVDAAPLVTPAPALEPAPAAAVPDMTSPPEDNAPRNSNAAYTGPSPIAGAVSSSTGNQGDDARAAAPPAHAARTEHDDAPAAAPATDSTASGAYQVQLGALSSQPAAQLQWDHLSGVSPALFSDKQPDIVSADVNGKTYYRLRTGSFASRAEAAQFCGQVSAAGHACTVANF